MFTRQAFIYGLEMPYCTTADVTVHAARNGAVDVIMYDGDEALFKNWVLDNVPLGIYVHVEKQDVPDVPVGIRFTHDYTVELGKFRYEDGC